MTVLRREKRAGLTGSEGKVTFGGGGWGENGLLKMCDDRMGGGGRVLAMMRVVVGGRGGMEGQ
jgi:hypothetical protein